MSEKELVNLEQSFEDSPKRHGSIGFWIGIVVVLGAVGFIVLSSMANTVHYYEVNQAVADSSLIGETIRLRGTVVDGSHLIREGTVDQHVFILTAEEATITVTFQGAVPDQFQDGASVIAVGELTDQTTFEAASLTAQCPSRYEGEAPTANPDSEGTNNSE